MKKLNRIKITVCTLAILGALFYVFGAVKLFSVDHPVPAVMSVITGGWYLAEAVVIWKDGDKNDQS